jgi:RNA polymerase sigma-70 factor, ECF subfamily
VALDDQDWASWDQERIGEGGRALERAMRLRRPAPCQLRAAIAALHVDAPSAEETDWGQIADLYQALARISPSALAVGAESA